MCISHFLLFGVKGEKMETKVKGKYSGKWYYASEAIRILDPFQATLYWSNGIEPLDIYPSRNYETNKPLLVFVFNRSETKEVFDKWCKHELV